MKVKFLKLPRLCIIKNLFHWIITEFCESLKFHFVLQFRYPTYVGDVAQALVQLADRKILHCGLYGTWHFTGKGCFKNWRILILLESFTAFSLAQEIGKLFKIDCSHISASTSEAVPKNAQLNCIALQVMSIGKISDFKETIRSALEPHITA